MKGSFNRIIGEHSTGKNGPLILILAGLHGNEPSGVVALQRVFDSLANLSPDFNGKLLGLAGNLPALETHKRYIDQDLNRMWSPDEIQRVKALSPKERNTEEEELILLLNIIEPECAKGYTDIIAVDLHTTSAIGGLFTIVTDRKENREIAERLHAPIIFDLADSLSTTTSRYFEDQDISCIAFEAGQHDDPEAIENHEAAIWLVLEKAGCLEGKDIPKIEAFRQRLQKVSEGLPKYVSVVYRHPIQKEDQYQTVPGFINFQKIEAGQLIGKDKDGPIHTPAPGMMLMPLYQPQGEDGYYVIQVIEEAPV